MALIDTDYERINEAMRADPSFGECVLEMIDTTAETRRRLQSGDEAEEAVVDVIRKTGQVLLRKWITKKNLEAQSEADLDAMLRPHQKKRSYGGRLSEI